MPIMFKDLVRLQRVVLWLLWDLLHAHKREEAWLRLRYWCFRTQKPIPNPHSTKPTHLETRFSGDCSGNRLFRAYGSGRAVVAREIGWACPCKGYGLDLFINQPELFINQPELCINWLELFIDWPELFLNQPELFINLPELFINQPELFINRPELFLNWTTHWSRLFLNLPGLMTWPDVFIILPAAPPNSKCVLRGYMPEKLASPLIWGSGFGALGPRFERKHPQCPNKNPPRHEVRIEMAWTWNY